MCRLWRRLQRSTSCGSVSHNWKWPGKQPKAFKKKNFAKLHVTASCVATIEHSPARQCTLTPDRRYVDSAYFPRRLRNLTQSRQLQRVKSTVYQQARDLLIFGFERIKFASEDAVSVVHSFPDYVAMKSRGAKIKIFSWARQWALGMGIVLVLVASPQVWAGISCLCEPQLGCEDSCSLTAHHSDATAEMQGESYTSETSTSCETATQAPGLTQMSFQSPPVGVCCVLQPQSEQPARYVLVQKQVYAVPAQSADSFHWSTTSALVPTFNPICRCSKRPLYLAFSCLLI
jgi:hypothetical protein